MGYEFFSKGGIELEIGCLVEVFFGGGSGRGFICLGGGCFRKVGKVGWVGYIW